MKVFNQSISYHIPSTDSVTYCNVIGAKHTDGQELIQYTDDGSMYSPITDYFLDPLMRKLIGPYFQHFDISVLNDLRNGDGTFLDFDPTSSVGGYKKSQGLVSKGDISDEQSGNFLYFNPVVGMPLSCAVESCDESSDNKLFPRDAFPVGNSTFQNIGVNDVRVDSGVRNNDVVDKHLIDFNSTEEGYHDDTVILREVIQNEMFNIFHWKVSKDSFFHFSVGGAAFYRTWDEGENASGRYSFILRGNNLFAKRKGKTIPEFGVVKINEN